MVEQQPFKLAVPGSTPGAPTIVSRRIVTEVAGIVLAAIVVGLSARGSDLLLVSAFAFASAALIGILAFGDALTARFLRRSGLGANARPVRFRLLMSILLLVSVGVTHWPLRAAFAISRGSFDQTAQRIGAGDSLPTPVHVGLFTIRKAELGGDLHAPIACLWTDLASAGKTGFVRCGDADPPFNLWSSLPLSDGWQFIVED